MFLNSSVISVLVVIAAFVSSGKTSVFSFKKNAVVTLNNSNAAEKYPASKGVWKGKRSAVVLTYDDALHAHLDHAIPALDSFRLKATFYLSGNADALHNRIGEWRAIARKGHELGNHTMFHPCDAQLPGRDWVKPEYDLSRYSISRIEDEIRMTNTLLQAIDGKKERTFAYPCGDTKIGDTYFLKNLENEFTGARAVRTAWQQIEDVQVYDISSFMVNGQTGDELVRMAQQAVDKGALLVFLFHGVGGEHNLDVSLPARRQLLQYLKQHEKDIWVAPMTEVASYISSQQKQTLRARKAK